MSLGAKLTLWVLLPLLVALILYAVITLKREQEVHQQEVLEEAERIANTLAISVAESLRRQIPEDLPSIVERSALTPDHFGLAVYDSSGRPLMTWGLASKVGSIGRQELAALSSLPRGVGSVEEEHGVPVRSHLVALTAGGELLGALRVSVSLQEIQETLTRERDYFLSMLAVVTVVLVVLISVTIRRTVSLPLAGLMERVADLGRGQLPEDVVVPGRDEVARLAQEFNALAKSLGETRQRLVRESEYAQNVIQSITDGIIGLDAACRIRTWNLAMVDRYGVSETEVLGRDLFEAFPLLDQEGLRKELDRLLTGESRDFALRYIEHQTLRRGRVVLNIRGSALQGATGETAGAVLAIEDVTDRVSMAQEVQQAEKLAVVGHLAAGIAHQIGTPLNVISGSAEYLMMEWGAERPRPHELDIIVAQTDRITKLIQQLLNFARPPRMELEPLKLNDLLREVLGLTEHQIAKEHIAIQTDFAPDLPPITGDTNQLEQAFLNIVINAWHAMPDGGTLAILTRLAPSGDRMRRPGRLGTPGVEVIIADTGTGIPP
ncbi:MAG TPA: histidine kinase dimerization/phospho-acceptor domain-containing protein, partial [Candidatus Acidoferrum sp.]|nr:histidine kinase dimerization/phospho-acceptor domain-containing protein [Candidatus Acidoferrum sp.]